MSRHRFVRNLDLDAEMASDSEEEGGMTQEEQAQMATSMPIARAQLKDLKPSISDDAIADSLWHYWFDIEKAVAWLRKDWEKKSEPIPLSLQPTPDEQRRRRSAKSARTQREDSPQPPISALQRLSLARKEARSGSPAAPTVTPASPSVDANKPLSKLALLAQKRKEEAQAKSSPASNAIPSIAAVQDSPSKPLSKLAQKMAAARAAKAEEISKKTSDHDSLPAESPTEQSDVVIEDDAPSELFSAAPISSQPSPFFDLLTSHKHHASPIASSSTSRLHLPYVRDEEKLERRVREAFGPGVESPDDIILKARGNRLEKGEASLADASSRPAPVKVAASATTVPATDTISQPEVGKTNAVKNKKPGTSKSARSGSGPSTQKQPHKSDRAKKPAGENSNGDKPGGDKGRNTSTSEARDAKDRSGKKHTASASAPKLPRAQATKEPKTTEPKLAGKPQKPQTSSSTDTKPPPKARPKPKPKIVQGPP